MTKSHEIQSTTFLSQEVIERKIYLIRGYKVMLDSELTRLYGVGTKITNKLLVDLYNKVSFPLISLVIVLAGIPFAMTSRRGGALLGVGISIAISLIYYGIIAISIALGKGGIIPPLVASWSANFIFASLGLYFVSRLR